MYRSACPGTRKDPKPTSTAFYRPIDSEMFRIADSIDMIFPFVSSGNSFPRLVL